MGIDEGPESVMNALSHPSLHRSWVEVDLSAIENNVRYFCSLMGPGGMVMPAVKADAYGHGAVETARAALKGGATRLAVATCLEGQELREAGIGVPVQVLGASFPEEVKTAVNYNLTLSLHDLHIARLVSIEAALCERTIPVQFKIDTGMGRLGILPENAVEAAREVYSLPGLRFEGVFMHFADAADDAYSRFQMDRFNCACGWLERAGIGGFIRHAASSTAALLYPEARYDMIRPGAGIYGYQSPAWVRGETPLVRALQWKSAVIQVKEYPPDSNLGYNRTFTTRRPTRIAVLPVGYADGFRREFSNRASVLVRGRRAPVVGMVSMDYIMVDTTDMDEDIQPGVVATLLGGEGELAISTEEMAGWADTIPYCITTGIGPRVGRMYRGG